MLEPGERVIRNGPSQRFAPFLDAMNSGVAIPGFAEGGLVGRVGSMPAIRGGGARTTNINVHSSYDLSGTSGDDAINAKIAASEQRASARAFEAARRATAGWQAQHQSEYG